MNCDNEICTLIRNGGVLSCVSGNSVGELYSSVIDQISVPGYDKAELLAELLEREKVLSTAVGNTIAIPHPRRPLMKTEADQRIYVCYLKDPIDMNAPDSLKVTTFFVLFTSNSQTHIKVLSSLAKALRSPNFRRELEKKPSADELCSLISQVI